MQILAFLFFATIFGLTFNLIREMLNASHERIGAALAGDYRLPPADAAPESTDNRPMDMHSEHPFSDPAPDGAPRRFGLASQAFG